MSTAMIAVLIFQAFLFLVTAGLSVLLWRLLWALETINRLSGEQGARLERLCLRAEQLTDEKNQT